MGEKLKRACCSLPCWLGLAAVLAWWWIIHPPGLGRLGYADDLGGLELARQVMADNIHELGRPGFFTHRMMAPNGISVAFYSWAMERDWIGAYFWMWNPDFPWLWLYFGISLTITYLGVGYILRRMGLSGRAGWGLAAVAVLFHVPRHFKTYVHYEHLIQHWVYIGIFLDAWIWQKVWREKRWSINLELWRALVLLATFGLSGYYWGPMTLEWLLVRVSILAVILLWRKKRTGSLEFIPKKAILPVALGFFHLFFDLRWFLPLVHEVMSLGQVWQGTGWEAPLWMIFRPVWLDWLFKFLGLPIAPINAPETVVTAGWLWILPAMTAIALTRKKKGGPGVGVLLPFLLFFIFLCAYIRGWLFGTPLHEHFPFMNFFRVASRMGLDIPATLGAMIALAWPELTRFAESSRARPWLVAFAISCLCEAPIFATVHVEVMGPMGPDIERLLLNVRARPGTTVLDMPFCMHAGNGICSYQLCPNLPDATAPQSFTGTHDKKVYGIYEGRLVQSQCQAYLQQPYLEWMEAWRSQRCFIPDEWTHFCQYLDQHPELSAILVYPDIWMAAGDPACLSQMEARLGPPLDAAKFEIKTTRDLDRIQYTRVIEFAPKCH